MPITFQMESVAQTQMLKLFVDYSQQALKEMPVPHAKHLVLALMDSEPPTQPAKHMDPLVFLTEHHVKSKIIAHPIHNTLALIILELMELVFGKPQPQQPLLQLAELKYVLMLLQ